MDKRGSHFETPGIANRLAEQVEHVNRLATPGFGLLQRNGMPVYPSSYSHPTIPPAVDKLKAAQYLDALTGNTTEKQFQLQVTDEDVKQLKEKENIVLQTEFDGWFAQSFDLAAPAEKEMMKKVYPEYFERQLQFNHETHQLQEDVARIAIKGFESFDDLVKGFAISKNGDLTARLGSSSLPEKGATLKDVLAAEGYKRGMFNFGKLRDSAARMGTIMPEAGSETGAEISEGMGPEGRKRIGDTKYNPLIMGALGFKQPAPTKR